MRGLGPTAPRLAVRPRAGLCPEAVTMVATNGARPGCVSIGHESHRPGFRSLPQLQFLASDQGESPTWLFPHPSREVMGGLNVTSVRRAWHPGRAHMCWASCPVLLPMGLDIQLAPPCTR